ncbi:RNA polymerase sigma-70 factor, ECF subfamily [Clostridium collagenovorans DSM 3089]|uniref:RNA polymerase sigma-70 factor, ECF subfamily n=1 Tax=Clostridium collagenovorans DSM 3089 TaxID=1121306 RepID=A0A1M5XA04_9CLOT|nr:sigma-70 family RNA polymerase sigma factor [Clostridium collagenovorans]SHH96687.1 RNA polymerase sigma-70 factor, ECF subfamily [Clostridium collagenovorans DSM 3089]
MIEDSKAIEKIVKKAMHGNIDAYGRLIELNKQYLYRTAFLYVKNEDLALDVVQECILKGFSTINNLREPKYFKSWITRILINSANDILKKSIKYTPIEEVEVAMTEENIELEQRLDLYDAIDVLPHKYRSVIILKYFDNLKISEIAYTMDIPEGSVKAYLSRAKEELKKYLKEDYVYAK